MWGLALLSGLVGFAMAWAIGAQDVSNALGTSVGSKALTVNQAIVVGAVFEFLGALMGGGVASTISKGIITPEATAGQPELFVKLMFSVLAGAFVWLAIATAFALPVSTTHSLVGSLIGVGMMTVDTQYLNTDTLQKIAVSWVTSPLMGGTISFVVFYTIHRYILTAPAPRQEALKLLPLYFASTVGVLTIFLVNNGPLLMRAPTTEVALMLAAFAALAVYCTLVHHIQRGGFEGKHPTIVDEEVGTKVAAIALGVLQPATPVDTDEVSEIDMAEKLFSSLMVITACVVAFAHGSNDVSNSIGPFAAVMEVYTTGELSEEDKSVPTWILIGGGMGIVVGLATYGYKCMATVGEKITKLTYTRGFAAQIGTASTVLCATILGLSVSTTHCLIGSISGVALVEDISKINKASIKKILVGWVVTMPASAIASLLIYAVVDALVTMGLL